MTGNWLRAWQVFTFPFLSILSHWVAVHTLHLVGMWWGRAGQDRRDTFHNSHTSYISHHSYISHNSHNPYNSHTSYISHNSYISHDSENSDNSGTLVYDVFSPPPGRSIDSFSWARLAEPSSSQISKVTFVTFASIVRTFVVLSPVWAPGQVRNSE